MSGFVKKMLDGRKLTKSEISEHSPGNYIEFPEAETQCKLLFLKDEVNAKQIYMDALDPSFECRMELCLQFEKGQLPDGRTASFVREIRLTS